MTPELSWGRSEDMLKTGQGGQIDQQYLPMAIVPEGLTVQLWCNSLYWTMCFLFVNCFTCEYLPLLIHFLSHPLLLHLNGISIVFQEL